MLFGFAQTLFSQDINLGPRITALGNTGVALRDIWSLQANQAGLVFLQNPTASISYRNSYLNPELSTQSAVISYPVGPNVLGLSFQNYGFSAYSEQKAGFAYARRFGRNVSAAINFNLHQVKIPQYGNAQSYSAEVGLQYSVTKDLTFGTHISNPSRSGFSTEVDAVIPVSLEFGAAYRLSDKVLLNSGFIKTLNSVTDFRAGLEYSVVNWMAFRGGLSVNPFRQFAGFGCQFSEFKIDAAASSHPYLGFSPQIALGYEF